MIGAMIAVLAEVVATQPVARGDILEPADLAGPAQEVSALVGQQARRPLFPGRRVRSLDVQEPLAVERQSAVTVLFVRGALTLRTEGRALSGGSLGEATTVALPGRRTPIPARITGVGEVQVML